MRERTVSRVVTGIQTEDGAGVKLTRVIGNRDVEDFDPFLMLDAFDSRKPADYVAGFPWHPHRGIETVTYLISGDIEHQDSLGNRGSIRDGSCQWMTAGGGILHQEMPQPSEHMFGAQLWINLPRKDKMTAPAYHDLKPEDIPAVEESAGTVRVISGEYRGVRAQMQGHFVKTTYFDVELKPESVWKWETKAEDTVFLYILSGALNVASVLYDSRRALLLTSGDVVSLTAGDGGVRFFFLAAPPLREPVAWGGPIVMNTEEELQQAFDELEAGTFVADQPTQTIDHYL